MFNFNMSIIAIVGLVWATIATLDVQAISDDELAQRWKLSMNWAKDVGREDAKSSIESHAQISNGTNSPPPVAAYLCSEMGSFDGQVTNYCLQANSSSPEHNNTCLAVNELTKSYADFWQCCDENQLDNLLRNGSIKLCHNGTFYACPEETGMTCHNKFNYCSATNSTDIKAYHTFRDCCLSIDSDPSEMADSCSSASQATGPVVERPFDNKRR